MSENGGGEKRNRLSDMQFGSKTLLDVTASEELLPLSSIRQAKRRGSMDPLPEKGSQPENASRAEKKCEKVRVYMEAADGSRKGYPVGEIRDW